MMHKDASRLAIGAEKTLDLHPYQWRAVNAVLAELMAVKRVVLQMPTGAGKTYTAAEMARMLIRHGPVWVMCHKQEIIRQTVAKFEAHGHEIGVVAPGYLFEPWKPVQVISVDALRVSKRRGEMPSPGTIFWDECQHAVAKTWARLMGEYPEAKHIGLTATPERLDGKGLNDLFDRMVLGPSIRELQDQGHLSRFRYFTVHPDDLRAAYEAVKDRKSDFRADELDAALSPSVLIGDAVTEYQTKAPGSRALLFAHSVEMSTRMAEAFNAAGVSALHLDAKTPDTIREQAVADLAAGRLKVICNVGLFTEGVDVPELDTVIMLRPTKSLALYLQMVGRALRVSEGKAHAVILDHAGLINWHGSPDAGWEWSLEGGARARRVAKAREAGERLRRCPACSLNHTPAPTCANCGFDYTEVEREIERFDGVLWEVIDELPPGFERPITFAHRYDLQIGTVCRWMRNGKLPHQDGLVLSSAADAWMVANRDRLDAKRFQDRPPEGFESQSQFGQRLGVGLGPVRQWLRLGMPSCNGIPKVPEATIWARTWIDENRPKFLEMLRRGAARKRNANLAGITKSELASRLNVGEKYVEAMLSKGMPRYDDGTLDFAACKDWIRRNVQMKNGAAVGCATVEGFSRRIGSNGYFVRSFVRRGLPTTPSGMILLYPGLRWIEENTKIHIPDSAWEGVTPDDGETHA